MAGAVGALGNAVLRRLIGRQNHAVVHVLARETITAGLKGVVLSAMPLSERDEVEAGEAEAAFKDAIALLDREATRGLIHKNAAARTKSRMLKRIRAIKPAAK